MFGDYSDAMLVAGYVSVI